MFHSFFLSALPLPQNQYQSFEKKTKTIGGIKYRKSTITNQSIIQKHFFSEMGSQRGGNEEPKCLKNGGFFKTSQLNNGGFGYI
jgi:hypothetical protein